MKKRFIAFVHAFSGILFLIKKEFHFKVHIFISVLVISYGYYRDLSSEKWVWVGTAITFVLISEGLNTVIEKVCDLIDESYNEKIKVVKDAAAGVVLIAAAYSIFVAIYVFAEFSL